MATILIIEDEPDSANAFTHVLAENGHDVCLAADGIDALTRLRNGLEPALIVMDLALPQRNGWELLEDLQGDARWRKIPVIIASAFADMPIFISHSSVRVVLRKPFDPIDIAHEIDSILSTPSASS